MNRKELDSFMKDIELLLPVRDAKSKRFIADMRDSISEYLSSNDEATREDVISKFGDPKKIATDYIETLDSDDLLDKLHTANMLRRIAMLLVAFVICALSIFSFFQYRGYLDAKEAIVTREQTVIEYGGSE